MMLRNRALKQCDSHLAFLRQLDRMGLMPDDLPMQEMALMATLDSIFDQVLQALEASPDMPELRQIEQNLDDMEAQWNILHEQVETVLLEEER